MKPGNLFFGRAPAARLRRRRWLRLGFRLLGPGLGRLPRLREQGGGDLGVIIKVGGWRSSAFKLYLESRAIEKRAVAIAQSAGLDHSSDSENGEC